MSRAAIDIGSNTIRMLLTRTDNGPFEPLYFRQVTRLCGNFQAETGLAFPSMERTLEALKVFSALLKKYRIEKIRAVGTSALRGAVNADQFTAKVKDQTGIEIDIVSGDTEAQLSCMGILSVLRPIPDRALLFDIGGGSTEFILLENAQICHKKSLPLGVVRLLENFPNIDARQKYIVTGLSMLRDVPIWNKWVKDGQPISLIGTAGTVTTLAALKLAMAEYDGKLVNNLVLQRQWLQELTAYLLPLPISQREELPGMEKGRADLIIPGLQIVESLMMHANADHLRVSDAGLLEGIFLDSDENRFHLTRF